MTVEGVAKLREELTHLKRVVRPSVTRSIAEAREGRIQEIEAKLSDAQVIDVTKISPSGKIVFGCTVTLVEQGSDQEVRYKIVGEDEADIKEDKISVLSPMARAMVGKNLGDTVVVKSPDGEREYDVDTVEHL